MADTRRRNRLMFLGIIAAAATVLALAGGIVVLLIGSRAGSGDLMPATDPDRGESARAGSSDRPVMTRDEFRAKVEGKSADEVITAVGKPDYTTDSTSGDPSWFYRRRTYDPVTDNVDRTTVVRFTNGRVTNINF